MGLEQRSGRTYYYEKRREGGRVVSRYVGKGQTAELAAQAAAAARQERERSRQEERKLRNEEKEIERQFKKQERLLATITARQLRLAGFQLHKGYWSKQRRPRKK